MNRSRSWINIATLVCIVGCAEERSDMSMTSTLGSGIDVSGGVGDGTDGTGGGSFDTGDGDSAETGQPGDSGGPEGDTGGSGGEVEPEPPAGLCHETPPDGAPQPPSPKSYSGGSCPQITAGYNTGFQSDGRSRQFMLVVPSDHDPNKSYPLVFAWYHISGNAMDFVEYIDVQAVADAKQMIFVIPQDSGKFDATWPVTPLDNDQANVDLVFFDDLLSCIHEQYSVNLDCVASAGVSAGGLWTAFLGQRRGKYLASNLVFSGGYPTEYGSYWWSWQKSPHRFASLVLWGGPSDELVIDFHQASLNYIDHLQGDGHYIVRCQHDQGHAPPPPDDGQQLPPVEAIFDFVLQHPYWYEGSSPYQSEGAPDDMPSYCKLP